MRIASGMVVLGAIASVTSCGAGKAAEAVAPKAPTAASALGEEEWGSSSCRAVSPHAEPLVVDWTLEDRVDLESAMKAGIAVVKHDCKTLKVLKRCHAAGTYPFVGVSRKEELIQITNADDLRMNVPLGVAKFGASMERGSTIDVGLVLVGKRTTNLRSLAPKELDGDCEGATHFVRAAHVGAFSVRTGTRGKLRAVADVFLSSAEAVTEASAKRLNKDGDLEACKASKANADAPPDQCQSATRIELAPIAVAASAPDPTPGKTPPPPTCPEGAVRQGGACTAKATGPFECDGKDLAVCETQCAAGNPGSCYRVAFTLEGQMWAPGSKVAPGTEARIDKLLDQACAADHARACYWIGHMLGASPVDPEYRDPKTEREVQAVTKGCSLGEGEACHVLSRLGANPKTGAPKDPQASLALARRGCLLGSFLACSDWAAMYESGLGIPKDAAKAAEVRDQACTAKDVLSCERQAEAQGKARHYLQAALAFERACAVDQKRCVLPPARSKYTTDEQAKQVLEEACALGQWPPCAALGKTHR